ncbi:exoribonuclease 1 [Sporodiniella umbellata]|nr:exoribonuclease 1 [Sporodiniella umbellata]
MKLQVASPIDQSIVYEVDYLSKSQADEAVKNSHKAFLSWKKVAVSERVAIMKKFCTLLDAKKDKVAESITLQMGRPIRYGHGETKGVLERANYLISTAEECLADTVIEHTDSVKRFSRKEPLGPVFIIAAWNYPYLTTVNNIIPALLAGNTVLLKQSPQTPQCADIFVDTLLEAGIPSHVVQAVHVQDEEANSIVQHPLIQYVNFTGSVAVGKTIRKSLGDSKHLIGCGMELGGKDPAYVLSDSDINFAVENIVDGAFFNSGQCCCSIERCYVHESVYDAFVEKAVALTKTYVLGNPTEQETTLGPMANIKFANTVREHVKDAVAKGAKALIDPFEADKPNTAYVGPQILTNVNHDMLVMKEETFGPVLAIMKVSSDEEAIQLMNDSDYGLTASIWTKSEQKAMEIGDQIETGTWFMNRCDYIDPALAWVGVKNSGLGFSMSKQGFNQFTSERYPMCSELITDNAIPEFDNLYLDMNGIVHNCSHTNSDDPHYRITEEQIWLGIFEYIDHLFSKIKPKKFFFLAIDGVAPRAKMNQQRSRRFRTAKDAEDARQKAIEKGEELPEDDPFDTNCITPGTEFMIKLTKELRYFISKKVSEDADWRNVEIVLSGPEVPGEGEHKIMEYIRLAKAQPGYNPNTRHCLYGLDADLLMLGLLSHDPHFALLREEVVFGKNQKKKAGLNDQKFYLLHLCLMREYLDIEFKYLEKTLPFAYDFERILDDFVLLALFIGNDFLPHLPNLHINEGALAVMFKIYKQVLPTCDGYLQDGGRVNMKRVQKVLDELSNAIEKTAFENEGMEDLYLAGKRPDGQKAREALNHMERKKNGKRMTMTEHQAEIFGAVRGFLTGPSKSLSAGCSLQFNYPFKNRDKKFIKKLTKELYLDHMITYTDVEKTTVLELIFHGAGNDSEESEMDEEALNARDRVLDKYESADIVSEEANTEEGEKGDQERTKEAMKLWKTEYYRDKMEIDFSNQKQMDELVSAYLVGIQWVLQYYYNGVASWGWFYPYHYAPKISDLVDIERFQDHAFQLGEPFKPYEQLMGVLPMLSRKLLPVAYRDLMTDPVSPIIDFYPTQFDLDMNGKKQAWEAIVKIPFIDEARLLQAMKAREQRLTKDEREMARLGKSYRFVYDEKLAQADPKSWPVYSSPLPGVFPDIRPCFVRETIYQLPVLPDTGLRKGLLPDAKIGKEALAGFPSLKVIDHDSHIGHHNVRVFNADSSNESVVISLKNRYKNASERELIKLFSYRSVYVGYPYLKQAAVIGVSSADCKMFVTVDQKGNKNYQEQRWNEKERDDWQNMATRLEHLRSKRFGLLVGDIDVVAHVCFLNGMHQTDTGAMVKQYVHPSLAEPVPFQTIVIRVANPDPRFIELPAPPIEQSHPVGSVCFFSTGKFKGSQAKVVGYTNGNVDIALDDYCDHPQSCRTDFGHQVVLKQTREIVYASAQVLCRELRISNFALSRLTSSLQVVERHGQRINIGLNLKFESKGECVPGYTRKTPEGFWEYSTKASALIGEYIQAFPEFVQMMMKRKGSSMLEIGDFGWTDEGAKYLQNMRAWLKARKVHDLTRVSIDACELEKEYIGLVEKAGSRYQTAFEQVPKKSIIIKNIPRVNLLRPADAPFKLENQAFNLGDRVVYATDTGIVPLGLKGTVVSYSQKVIDVVFDKPFLGGTTLDGGCQETRGAALNTWQVINYGIERS